MRGIVLGAAGIGRVHVREFLNNNIDNVGILNSTLESTEKVAHKLSNEYGKNIICYDSFSEVLEKRPNIVSICTPNDLHIKQALALLKLGAYVLVEKPLYWDNILKGAELIECCDKLFESSNGRLYVNHPSSTLAAQLKKIASISKEIDFFKISYYTNGKYTGKDVAVDLLPHALSALTSFLPNKHIDHNEVSINNINSDLKTWYFDGLIMGVKCIFDFKQNEKIKESELIFNINSEVYRRKQSMDNNKNMTLNMIAENTGDVLVIDNPMSVNIHQFVDAAIKKEQFLNEKEYVMGIMKSMVKILAV